MPCAAPEFSVQLITEMNMVQTEWEVPKMTVDPVCGTILDHFEYPEQEEYNDRIYFFGSLECAQRFRENPGKYATGHEELGEPIPEYTKRKPQGGE